MKAEDLVSANSAPLQQIRAAVASHNWLDVNDRLQQLPAFASQTDFQTTEAQIQAQIIEIALQVLLEGDFQQKWQAAKFFPLMGENALPSLIALAEMEATDSETKWFIASILGKFKTQIAVIALAEMLQTTQEPDLIAVAAKSLAQIGDLAVATLTELLEKPPYRLIAAKSLAHIRLSSALPALIQLAKDAEPEIRVLAIEALGSFHSLQVTKVLVSSLQDSHSSVRKEAVTALGFCRELCAELDLVEQLEPLLHDLNLDVCRHTAIALSRMKNESATCALDLVLRSSNTPLALKIDLVRALAWSEVDVALDCLEAACNRENSAVRQEIITVLGRMSDRELQQKAVAILKNCWHSSDSETWDFDNKKVLATALGELSAVTAQDILQELAKDSNKTVQLYAVASLKKIEIKQGSSSQDVVS